MNENDLLSHHDKVKEFLSLLENNEMSADKKTVELLLHYIDQMDKQFNEVSKELKSVRIELTNIQDKTIRAMALKTVDNVSEKVDKTKQHFQLMKQHVKSTIINAVEEFKTKGKESLLNAMEKLNVVNVLSHIKSNLDKATYKLDKDIDKITKLGNEVHQINGHFKNIGRMILGKNTKSITSRDSQKGILFSIQKSLFSIMDKTEQMSMKTNDTINRLKTAYEKRKEKNSVKTDLNDLKKNKVKSSKKITREVAR